MKARPDSHWAATLSVRVTAVRFETSPHTSARDLLLKENETKHIETTLY